MESDNSLAVAAGFAANRGNAATAKAVPITERLLNIKIGSYTVDEGSHSKHFAVRAVCEEAAQFIEQLQHVGRGLSVLSKEQADEIERLRKRESELQGECLLLADILRDAYGVVKTIEGEDADESDKLTGLCLSMAHALALYDDGRITTANAGVTGSGEKI